MGIAFGSPMSLRSIPNVALCAVRDEALAKSLRALTSLDVQRRGHEHVAWQSTPDSCNGDGAKTWVSVGRLSISALVTVATRKHGGICCCSVGGRHRHNMSPNSIHKEDCYDGLYKASLLRRGVLWNDVTSDFLTSVPSRSKAI